MLVKVASLGFLRFSQPNRYPENTLQMFFFASKPQHEAYLHCPPSCVAYQGTQTVKISVSQFQPSTQHEV